MKISRTHIEAFRECARLAYLTYWHDGQGIVRSTLNLEAETGTMVHTMLASALRGDLASGIIRAFKDYDEKVAKFGLQDVPDIQSEVARQKALAEALARGWAKVRLPYIMETYEVVDVEKEYEVKMEPTVDEGESVVLMQRRDAVIRRKEDDEISVLEFKTTGYIGLDYLESWRYDSQTLSHLIGLREQYGREGLSVLMEFLYKGIKRDNQIYSPLVSGYKKTEAETDGIDFGAVTTSYEWETQRGKGWQRFNVWEEAFAGAPQWMGPIQFWVESCLDFSTLAAQFVTREVFRDEREIEEWTAQVATNFNTVAGDLEAIALLSSSSNWTAPSQLELVKMQAFPARLDRNCFSNKYRRKCPMLPICFNEIKLDNALQSGYVKREPHHPNEFEV